MPKQFTPSCLERYGLWMKWIRAKKNKKRAKEKLDKHEKSCLICIKKQKMDKQLRGLEK